MKNIVAIVGKPNVGKSTLFNRLVGKRLSIVHDEPGVTRDRLYYDVEWGKKKLSIIDTGGIDTGKKDFQQEITTQANIAIQEAEHIIFVIDGREHLTTIDQYVLQILRKSGKKIFVAANKLEGNRDFDTSLWGLGVENIFSISASHGEGVGDLLDAVTEDFDNYEEIKDDSFRMSIIGKPNAGKSSLLNILTGEERSIVSDIAGTTRDSVNSMVDINGEQIKIVDTAGISKKSKLIESVEHYSLSRAMSSLDNSFLTILVIDATKKLSHFDARIAGYAMESIMPIILVVNKWDLIEKNVMSQRDFTEKIRKEYKFLPWAPIVFISAKNGTNIDKFKDKVVEVKQNLKKRVKTSVLNEIITDIQLMQPAPNKNGGRLNMSFCQQIDSRVPSFLITVNHKRYLHFSYERYIENQFREYLGFEGTPIRLIFKNKKDRHGEFDEK